MAEYEIHFTAGATKRVVESSTVRVTVAESVIIVTEMIPLSGGPAVKQFDTLYPWAFVEKVERWEVFPTGVPPTKKVSDAFKR